MMLEPGPLDPLDQAYYERVLEPSDPGALPIGAGDASGGLQATATALDLVYEQLATAPGPPDDEGDYEQLVQVAVDAGGAVDGGTGDPDPSISSNIDGTGQAVDDVHTDMADTPSVEEATNAIIPADYASPYDFDGNPVPYDQLSPEQQALVNNIPGGDLSQLPEPGSRDRGDG
jgi:hypothetical protein